MENEILMSLVAQRKQVFNLMTPANVNSNEGRALWQQYIMLSDAINEIDPNWQSLKGSAPMCFNRK